MSIKFKDQINHNSILAMHAGCRLQNKSDNWYVINLYTKKEYKVSSLVVNLIITFIKDSNVNSSYNELSELYDLNFSLYSDILDNLINIEVIVPIENKGHIWCKKVMEKWINYGWTKAADYHILTYNYPFLDYKEDGQSEDIDIMKIYVTKEPDTNRGKKYSEPVISLPTPTTIDVLKGLDMPYKTYSYGGVTKTKILEVMSAVFGVLRKRKFSNNQLRADAVRKTVPSGGARHPSEGYLFNIGIEDLPKGIYHFSSQNYTLDMIADIPSEIDLQKIFPGPYRAKFRPKAFIVITSLFERNMYRYREPRTFRTIFIDIGHIVENVSFISKHMGIASYPHQGIDEKEIEKLLCLDPLQEGAIIAIALGDRFNEE